MAECLHCGQNVPANSTGGAHFCCHGCAAAYHLIENMGLESYYQKRCLDPETQPIRPDENAPAIDFTSYVQTDDETTASLHLMVEGLHCAACVWLIETVLSRQPGVVSARLNMTTRRLVVRWRIGATDPQTLCASVSALGYRLAPYDPVLLGRESERQEKALLRAMVVAGFAAGNVMLLSISVWSGQGGDMNIITEDMMHWLSALIALPAIAYAGRTFFSSAIAVLRRGHTNMDVPISLAIALTAGMSLLETMRGSDHVYFDSAVTLLFFLLVGRYLDRRARGRARSAGEHLLALATGSVTVIGENGGKTIIPPAKATTGMHVLVARGERIAIDGVILSGTSDIDASLISGETIPTSVAPGDRVFAGTLNVSAPLHIETTAVGENTLLAEIVRLMENAEQGRAKYVAIADRVARLYAPAVHGLAALTFLGWVLLTPSPWQDALMTAISVLIITCPCALALAVPTVQVVAGGRFLKRGILLKSATALERLTRIDTVVLDKTGTLTLGRPELIVPEKADAPWRLDLALAYALARESLHPLSQSLTRAFDELGGEMPSDRGISVCDVNEIPGRGLRGSLDGEDVRLGNAAWCGLPLPSARRGTETSTEPRQSTKPPLGPEIWLRRPDAPPRLFQFIDSPRPDATQAVAALKRRGLNVLMLSGDREGAVAYAANRVGIADWRAGCTPSDKTKVLENLAAQGHLALMVGDGLNDAPALAAAHVSMSPSSAIDISQNAADIVFQGARLDPIVEAIDVAKQADGLVKSNFALSFVYNAVTIPLAMLGHVTPLLAAVAMSTSSIVVIANALRLARARARV
ncbi:heavy metal translocating P-type ATPase [Varunaivibrio sulfuroxidans]|uniref:Cu2+-exporting ATPase n=1 Tax=Varunaivibrio sulfuroxidans TaxID=1773489 RepID=A0A4V2UP06_9PROT|nr:heavy metal translocating P-type ATPase metal-binding domain-containing protein [Varunaivibrio sulfuroxidans]TCS64081.1 Cu2+-exporting ATPase [Varunaivibrio sulfuroxidans]WES31469.1 heavy metal translocating P-type ATPase metal-binding domain-containing protein [Varunaivibrio sulfuroxidans]